MALSKIDPDGLNIGQIGGRRNLIINGAMQVAQRGTSSSNTGLATVDRFAGDHNAITKDQSQETLTSSDSPYALGFRNFMRLENTGVSSATNAFARFFYKFEAQDVANSGWDYTSSSSAVTLSFWVRSSLAGTYYYLLRSSDGTAQNYASSVVLTADTWTKVTKTIYGDSNITINNDNGNGLELQVWPYLGTDYTSSSFVLDQWDTYSSSAQVPDYSQNWANTAGATFDLTGVQLEVGDTATPFEHRSYGEEEILCKRYYQAEATNRWMHPITTDSSGGYRRLTIMWSPEMRATPTTTGTFAQDTGTGNGNQNNTAKGNIFYIDGATSYSQVSWTADAEL